MKPPRVPASMVNPDWDGRMREQARADKPDRHPKGILPNALPVLWLALPASGEYWLMKESSDGPVCLAFVRLPTVEHLAASRAPVELVPA